MTATLRTEAIDVECIMDGILSKESSNKPKVEVGKKYQVSQVFTCPCGEEHYDIGQESKLNYVTCHKCGAVLFDSAVGGIHWAHSSRFKKV